MSVPSSTPPTPNHLERIEEAEDISLIDVAEGHCRENDLVEACTGGVECDDNFTVEEGEADHHCGDRGDH